ncbi:hypothetical protein RRG08_022869 [Elysia crispata]|uniref:Uncharacterized protein n=1 Tax=Elysia crispata TaxID=231223 RepID=A0AAE0Z2B8_9GAST|nr:hypothetical protein RRG08_022869 [Elysia crispata]
MTDTYPVFDINSRSDTYPEFDINSRSDTYPVFDVNSRSDTYPVFDINSRSDTYPVFDINSRSDTYPVFDVNSRSSVLYNVIWRVLLIRASLYEVTKKLVEDCMSSKKLGRKQQGKIDRGGYLDRNSRRYGNMTTLFL